MGKPKSLIKFPSTRKALNQQKLIRVTTTTETGFRVVSRVTSEVRYLPFETLLPLWLSPQKILIVTEAELWLMLFALAKIRGAYTILINARVSDRSYPNYKRFTCSIERFLNI